MSNIEKIRAEIERRIALYSSLSEYTVDPNRIDEDEQLLSFIDTLSEEEPSTKGYDEAYLNEKIAKASKTWEGVDVDKYMDEVRGREPDKSLEEAAEEYAVEYAKRNTPQDADGEIWRVGDVMIENRVSFEDGFKAGAKWRYQKDRGEFAKIKAKTWCEGFDAHKKQMMKDAVEGKVYFQLGGIKRVKSDDFENPDIHLGDKVKLIIVKED